MSAIWFFVSETLFGSSKLLLVLRLTYYIISAIVLFALMKRQSALREGRDELKLVVDKLRESVLIHRDEVIIYANPCALEFFGAQSEEELVGKHILGIVCPEYREIAQKRINLLAQGVPSNVLELQFKTLSGDVRDVEVVGVPIVFQGTSATQVIIRDITERKKEQRTLTEVVELFRLIEENMHDAICVMEHSGRIYYSSPSHKSLLGRDPHVENHGVLTSANVHPDDLQYVEMAFSRNSPFQTELRVKDAQNNWITVELSGVPINSEHHSDASVVLVLRNITERKLTEEALHRSDKLAAVGELAAGIAHEIRNPLTSLKGFLQLMLPEATGVQKRYFDVMHSEINRMEAITNELLVLAKPQIHSRVVTSVATIIEDVITLLGPRAILDNVMIEMNQETANVLVECNPNQIKQVFVNITKNAIEAMPHGGTLHIEMQNVDDKLHMIFRDEGSGMSIDRISHIGMPFFTTKECGTGLGLLVSSRIIDNHHGKLEISSKVGNGTTVTVVLPSVRSQMRVETMG